MGKNNSQVKPKEKAIRLPIEWHYPDDMKRSGYANHLIIQSDGDEVFLSFFELKPPTILGDDAEEVQKQLDAITHVKAECTARVAIGKRRMRDFVKVIQDHLDKREASEKASGEHE